MTDLFVRNIARETLRAAGTALEEGGGLRVRAVVRETLRSGPAGTQVVMRSMVRETLRAYVEPVVVTPGSGLRRRQPMVASF